MSKTEATPRPWIIRKLSDGTPFIECPKETLSKPYGQEILADDYFDDLSKEADCELIVKAVNNYDRLVDLVKRLHASLDTYGKHPLLDESVNLLLKELKP